MERRKRRNEGTVEPYSPATNWTSSRRPSKKRTIRMCTPGKCFPSKRISQRTGYK
uniref:Uncharacterized protein n=1 Tax=Anopheles epiroticus TaxID=199890 RepID=A0A182NZN4_9DIPT